MPAAGWRPEDGLDGGVRALRRAAERARPRGGLHRHRQPGGDRPGLPLPAHHRLGPRLPVPTDPRRDRGRRRAVGAARCSTCSWTRSARWRRSCCPISTTSRLPRGYYSAGQRLLADWDFRMDADSAAAAYYNVVWRNLLELTFGDELTGDLRPDGGQRWFAVMTELLDRPEDQFWDDRTTEEHVERRDDIIRTGTDRRPRRPDLAAVTQPRRVDLGRPARARAAVLDAGGVGDRGRRAAVQPGRLGGRRRRSDRRCDDVGRRARASR